MPTLPAELVYLALTHVYPPPSLTVVDVQLERDRTALMRSACLVDRTWTAVAQPLSGQHVLLSTPAQADGFACLLAGGIIDRSVVRTVTVEAAIDDTHADRIEIARRQQALSSALTSDDTSLRRTRRMVRGTALPTLVRAVTVAIRRCPNVEAVRASRAENLIAAGAVWPARAIVVDQLCAPDASDDDDIALEALAGLARAVETSPLVRSLTILRSWPSAIAIWDTLAPGEAAARLTHLHLGSPGHPVSVYDQFVLDNDTLPGLVSLTLHILAVCGTADVHPASGDPTTAVAVFGTAKRPRLPALRTLVLSVAEMTPTPKAVELVRAVPRSVTALDVRIKGSIHMGAYSALLLDYSRRGTIEAMTMDARDWGLRWRAAV